MPHEMVVRDA